MKIHFGKDLRKEINHFTHHSSKGILQGDTKEIWRRIEAFGRNSVDTLATYRLKVFITPGK